MTKSKGQNSREDYDPFGDDGDTGVVREEADDENDEARMTNDERMTKPKGQSPRDDYDEAFWNDDVIPVVREEPSENRVYDLEERTARFGEAVIDFARSIPQGPMTNRIISQLVGAGTSVGANYVEADDAVSKKDFFEKYRYMPERSARSETFSPHGRARSACIEAASSNALD